MKTLSPAPRWVKKIGSKIVNPKIKPLQIAVLGFLVFLLPLLIYLLHIRWLGFPDGHLTEWDRFQERMFPFFVLINTLAGGGSIFLISRKSSPRRSTFVFILYLLPTALCALILALAAAVLDTGVGG